MGRALYHKFTQSDRLLKLMICSFDYEFIEASPTDLNWGIGNLYFGSVLTHFISPQGWEYLTIVY